MLACPSSFDATNPKIVATAASTCTQPEDWRDIGLREDHVHTHVHLENAGELGRLVDVVDGPHVVVLLQPQSDDWRMYGWDVE